MADRKALITEGKRLVKEQDATGWRLAEIVHELREDRMTYQAIADELGWTRASTARHYDKALLLDPAKSSWADAFTLAALPDDRATAVRAVSESEGIAIGTAERFRRPETKAIAASISSLPDAEKEQVARDLANDPGFMAGALAQHNETRVREVTQQGHSRHSNAPTPMEKAINTARLRIAISKAEEAAQTVLDGVSRSDLDEDDIASLERSADRARILADYINAVLGIGDMNKALEELLS